MRHEEDKIQMAICQYLSLNKYLFFSVPNELGGAGKDVARRMAKFKAMGLRAGASDLVILFPNGKTLFIEVKSAKGKQNDNQIKFENDLKKLNHNYYIVRSVDDLIEVLKK